MPKGVYQHKKGILYGMTGKHHTEESNKKNRLAHLGKSLSTKGRKNPKGSLAKMGSKNPMYGKKQSKELIEKRFKDIVGENHYAWIKDRSKVKIYHDKRGDTLYRQWHKQVFKRDNWKCRMINENCKGKIEAHHILSWRDFIDERYNVNNGITLCEFHHPLKYSEEIRLAPTFQQLISQIK